MNNNKVNAVKFGIALLVISVICLLRGTFAPTVTVSVANPNAHWYNWQPKTLSEVKEPNRAGWVMTGVVLVIVGFGCFKVAETLWGGNPVGSAPTPTKEVKKASEPEDLDAKIEAMNKQTKLEADEAEKLKKYNASQKALVDAKAAKAEEKRQAAELEAAMKNNVGKA